jgi:hypothetical protein
MAIWPFRRRSSRKRSRSGANLSDAEGAPPARSQTEGAITRAGSQKKQRTESPTMQGRHRAYSFSPGRRDSIRVSQINARADRPGQLSSMAIAEMDEPAWERTPTLRHRGSKRDPSRRKSSKKKKDAVDREAEIKAMSKYTPTRPAAESWQSGRPMKRESRRTRMGGTGSQRNPASDVSLPLPGSIHSTMSSDSELGSYRVSALSSLAPRPTLRYTQDQRWKPSQGAVLARDGSQKRAVAERMHLPEETMRANKRVDDLADDLDAGELRELLERDERRRERKRRHEQEKMERRLARRAERQRREEAEARRNGTPSPENMERGVVGRELVGLGLEPPSAVVTSSKQRESDPVDKEEGDATVPKRPSDHFEPLQTEENDNAQETLAIVPDAQPEPKPDSKPQEEPVLPVETAPALAPVAEGSQPTEQPASLSQPSLLAGLLRAKKSMSKSTLNSDRERYASSQPSRIDEEDSARKSSIVSQKGGRFSLASLLRWGSKGVRGSRPSSFSNTSREEMQAAVAAAHARTQSPAQSNALAQAQALARLQGDSPSPTPEALTGKYIARKVSAAGSKRTISRFREDLPEFPLSPPDSRVQSPEADLPPLPAVAEQGLSETGAQPIPIPRYDTPSSGRQQVSPEPQMSMSLASIDSEASWLSGRMGSKRASTIRDALAKANRREYEHSSVSPSNSTQEDLAIADDEYMSRLAPKHSANRRRGSHISGEGRPSSDEGEADNDDMRWGAVGARAEMIHSHIHDRATMKSREGLLEMNYSDEESVSASSPTSPTSDGKVDVQQAKRVSVGGGHARNFSAGSAKLFEITRNQNEGRSSLSENR